jgi:prophage antirepressor-like protein
MIITNFNADPKLVRVQVDEAGQCWFVAKDVAESIGLQWNGSRTLEGLDEDERGGVELHSPGGPQSMLTINESGLYTLILRCRDATTPGTPAHRFRKWVTSEVIPSIRKTGSYNGKPAPVASDAALPSDPVVVRAVALRAAGFDDKAVVGILNSRTCAAEAAAVEKRRALVSESAKEVHHLSELWLEFLKTRSPVMFSWKLSELRTKFMDWLRKMKQPLPVSLSVRALRRISEDAGLLVQLDRKQCPYLANLNPYHSGSKT